MYKNMNQNYMKEKPILPLLLSLSLPAMISMMVNSLYNIIDSIFVAKIGENAMTAISVISGFMCGLAIMIFELRINLNQSNGELGENAHEIEFDL